MTELSLPDAPTIPGLRFRTYRGEEDLPDMAKLMDASWVANGDTPGADPQDLGIELRNSPHIDPRNDLVLGFVDRRLVARSMIEWAESLDGAARHYQTWGDVHPDWRRRGIGTAMWRFAIERLTALASGDGFSGARYLTVPWMRGGDTGGAVLAQRLGYRQVRVYHHMTRPTLDGVEVSPLPGSLEVRSVTAEDLPRVWAAMTEAFRDHFGAWDTGERTYRMWTESPVLALPLLVVAFDGDEVAGGVHGEIHPEENLANDYLCGWTDPIYVRRAWRRQGLASALLGRALIRLREHGMTSAQLDVDTENANQALTLYERHGFVSDRHATEWHRPLSG